MIRNKEIIQAHCCPVKPENAFGPCLNQTVFELTFHGDYRVRKFNCWSQFTTMMYAQVTGKVSLRALELSLQNQAHHFYHLCLKKVSRSTVADANQNREWHIYEELFTTVLLRCQDVAPKHKFHFQNKLQSFDASIIKLCLEMFPWAKLRQAKGAIKLHARVDHSGQIPGFINVTTGKTHEIKVARTLKVFANVGGFLREDRKAPHK